MSKQLKEKIEKLDETIKSLSKIGLLIIEDETESTALDSEIKNILSVLDYQECKDYLEVMNALSTKKNKIFYIEQSEKLDGLVLEIVAEFEAGIVSLADRKNKTGLMTAKWNPNQISFVIILTRAQIEKSYPRLFEYINISQSI